MTMMKMMICKSEKRSNFSSGEAKAGWSQAQSHPGLENKTLIQTKQHKIQHSESELVQSLELTLFIIWSLVVFRNIFSTLMSEL